MRANILLQITTDDGVPGDVEEIAVLGIRSAPVFVNALRKAAAIGVGPSSLEKRARPELVAKTRVVYRSERLGFPPVVCLKVNIPRQSRGLYKVSRSKRLLGDADAAPLI